jgi:hypothetical protein
MCTYTSATIHTYNKTENKQGSYKTEMRQPLLVVISADRTGVSRCLWITRQQDRIFITSFGKAHVAAKKIRRRRHEPSQIKLEVGLVLSRDLPFHRETSVRSAGATAKWVLSRCCLILSCSVLHAPWVARGRATGVTVACTMGGTRPCMVEGPLSSLHNTLGMNDTIGMGRSWIRSPFGVSQYPQRCLPLK